MLKIFLLKVSTLQSQKTFLCTLKDHVLVTKAYFSQSFNPSTHIMCKIRSKNAYLETVQENLQLSWKLTISKKSANPQNPSS